MSDNHIKNIKGEWSGSRLLTLSNVMPGGAPSQNLVLRSQADFFGPVRLEWQNARGKTIVKSFLFTKDQLPDTKHHNFDQVYIFLTQEGMEIFTRGKSEEKSSEVRKRWQQVNKFSTDHLNKKCPPVYYYGCENDRKKGIYFAPSKKSE